MSSGTALRQLQQAHAALKKARQVMAAARGNPGATQGAVKAGWESLVKAHRLLSEIPLSAVTEPVLTKQLSVERYATALLVRLRRLLRNENVSIDTDDEDSDADADFDDNSEI